MLTCWALHKWPSISRARVVRLVILVSLAARVAEARAAAAQHEVAAAGALDHEAAGGAALPLHGAGEAQQLRVLCGALVGRKLLEGVAAEALRPSGSAHDETKRMLRGMARGAALQGVAGEALRHAVQCSGAAQRKGILQTLLGAAGRRGR
jgi:hypothetical protein